MEVFELDFGTLQLDRQELYRSMGYGTGTPDEELCKMLDQLLTRIKAICQPRCGYKLYQVEAVGEREVLFGGRKIHTGTIITPFFRNAEYFALFVATAGSEFDRWLHDLKSGGDIVQEFIVDAIGSEIAEAAARALADQLAERMRVRGMAISNSYSPGYCGWPVTEQQQLFALLPPSPCGVTLSSSSLMSPIKSVSGVIAVGSKVEKMAYGCALCGKADCYKNRIKNR